MNLEKGLALCWVSFATLLVAPIHAETTTKWFIEPQLTSLDGEPAIAIAVRFTADAPQDLRVFIDSTNDGARERSARRDALPGGNDILTVVTPVANGGATIVVKASAVRDSMDSYLSKVAQPIHIRNVDGRLEILTAGEHFADLAAEQRRASEDFSPTLGDDADSDRCGYSLLCALH